MRNEQVGDAIIEAAKDIGIEVRKKYRGHGQPDFELETLKIDAGKFLKAVAIATVRANHLQIFLDDLPTNPKTYTLAPACVFWS